MKKFLLSLVLISTSSIPTHAAVVRASLEFVEGTPAVSLTLNGKPTQFILDTGASLQLSLPKTLADKVDRLKPGPDQRTFDLRGVVQESPGFTIADFRLSGINFGSVSGNYLSPSGISVSGPEKFNDRIPVLGLTLFENKAVLIDFSGRQFVLADSVGEILPRGSAGWRSLPTERTKQGLIALFKGGRKQYRMALDTGGNMSVVKADVVHAEEEKGTCPMQINGQASCQYIEMAAAEVDSITPILVGLPAAFQADGVAGRDFFEKIRLIYDGATGKVYLQDAAENSKTP